MPVLWSHERVAPGRRLRGSCRACQTRPEACSPALHRVLAPLRCNCNSFSTEILPQPRAGGRHRVEVSRMEKSDGRNLVIDKLNDNERKAALAELKDWQPAEGRDAIR